MLAVIVRDVGLTIVARRYGLSMPRALRMLTWALDLWWKCKGQTKREARAVFATPDPLRVREPPEPTGREIDTQMAETTPPQLRPEPATVRAFAYPELSMAQPKFLVDELVRVSADLDELIADISNGRPSQTSHDGHIDQAEQLAVRIRTAARGPGRSVNPPLARVGTGYRW